MLIEVTKGNYHKKKKFLKVNPFRKLFKNHRICYSFVQKKIISH